MLLSREVEILECTLRDGSYAIDFNFTSSDTALLTEKISSAGFNWIEIGHGMGLGASQSGKGRMPHTDLDLLKAAKLSTKANIGMFYIPALSCREDLQAAVDSGLDFVRIGANATEAEEALADIEYARKMGLTVGMNFMKSYSVSPSRFGDLSRMAVDAGAEMIYLVDSVGGMTPGEVDSYFSAVKSKCECALGFHGHDNLKMAVANTLQAYASGATFLDATIMGLGRGAGNAASESLVCLLENSGVNTGIDINLLLDIADTYVAPLLENISMYNTKEVAMGFGKMHSSHMPAIIKVCAKYNADEKRVTIAMGKIDPVNVDPEQLEQVAKDLADTRNIAKSLELVSYPGLSEKKDQIAFGQSELDEFIKGMTVTAAKRRDSMPVIEVIYTGGEQNDFVSAECVWDSDNIILGRIISENYEALIAAVAKVDVLGCKFIYDPARCDFSEHGLDEFISELGIDRIFAFNTGQLKASLVSTLLSSLGNRPENKTVLIYGNGTAVAEQLVQYSSFEQVFVVDPEAVEQHGVAVFKGIEDWVQLNMMVDVIYLAEAPNSRVMKKLLKLVSKSGKVLNPHDFYSHISEDQMVSFNPDSAYENVVYQIKSIGTLLNS
ncbi:MAG: hypothetical protein BA863_18535 [Desulfovibrio sp. S3730MH75]|nr:MAG: hypothetical protein BA863_18535 [Desulfovibrio sp. S3730MH75]